MSKENKKEYKEIIGVKDPSKGMKWDAGKLDWSLLPWEVIEKLVVRFTAGKEKYGPNNWQKLDNAKDRYTAAAFRHWMKYVKGERWDEDPNFENMPSTHLQAMLWNLVVLCWFELQDIKKEEENKDN